MKGESGIQGMDVIPDFRVTGRDTDKLRPKTAEDGFQVGRVFDFQPGYCLGRTFRFGHDFAGKVIENAATSFYRYLARATETFIRDDYQILTSVLTAWSSNSKKSAEIESPCGQC